MDTKRSALLPSVPRATAGATTTMPPSHADVAADRAAVAVAVAIIAAATDSKTAAAPDAVRAIAGVVAKRIRTKRGAAATCCSAPLALLLRVLARGRLQEYGHARYQTMRYG